MKLEVKLIGQGHACIFKVIYASSYSQTDEVTQYDVFYVMTLLLFSNHVGQSHKLR